MSGDYIVLMPSRQKSPGAPVWPDDPDHRFIRAFLGILRDARAVKGWTIRELEERSGIDDAVITRGENCQRIPGMITLRKWVRALELDWGDIYRDAERQASGKSL